MVSERLRCGPAAGRMSSAQTPAITHAIGEADTWRSLPTAVEDQQLLLDQHGFGHGGPEAAGPGKPNEDRQQMQQKDAGSRTAES